MSKATALVGLFLLAGVVRNGYALAVFEYLGPDGLMGPDSYAFVLAAEYLATGGGVFDGEAGFPIDLMPIAFWIMSLMVDGAAASTPGNIQSSPLPFVLLQGWIDAVTCILTGILASRLLPVLQVPAAVLAALNPTQIVVAGMFYTDTIFLCFSTAGLLFLVLWFDRPTWSRALGVGLFFAAALMTRPFLQYWLLLLPGILVLCRAVRAFDGQGFLRTQHCILIILVTVIAAAPILTRNHQAYGSLALHSQSGSHLLNWVVPLVREDVDGTPRAESLARGEALYRERFGDKQPANPFAYSDRLRAIAADELGELGPGAIALAWVKGAVLNLAAPAMTLATPVSSLPRTGFFDTPGDSLIDKVGNFLFDNNPFYTAMLFAGGVLVPIWVLGAFLGVAYIPRLRGPALGCGFLMFLWAGYTLGLAGPVVSPKYRLPMEPAWIVLLAYGGTVFMGWIRPRRWGGLAA